MKNIKKILLISSIIILTAMVGYKSINATERIEYVIGSDRYETSSLIAERIEYKQAILINGVAMADGLSASGLSGAINGPILLTEKDIIPPCIIERLKDVTKVYIIGGTGVISNRVEEQIINMGIEFERLGGDTRYDTSKEVAKKVQELAGLKEIFYVNGQGTYADAMSIAPVAAKLQSPVIITNGNNTDYIIDGINAYIVGGSGVMSNWFDSIGVRVSGNNRYETNKNVVDNFFDNKDKIYLSNSQIFADALSASALKEPIALIDNYSDKTVLAGSKCVVALGGVNKSAVAQAKSYLFGQKVVFYTQHQDDETIFAASGVIDAIESVGRENVYVVLLTDGTDSSVFRKPRYKELLMEQKEQLRNNEIVAACNRLGVDINNLLFLREKEAAYNSTTLKNKILEFENKFEDITHITHTYKYDIQSEHLESGMVLYDLYKSGQVKDCRFFARSSKESLIPKDKLILSIADNKIENDKVIMAVNEYSIDNKDMVREGIGYKSVRELFEALLKDNNKVSYLHDPE